MSLLRFIHSNGISNSQFPFFLEKNEVESIEIMSIVSPKITSNPLFSCLISFYILILLYFPHRFSPKILISPVALITASILLYLLRLGAIKRENREKISETEETEFSDEEHKGVGCGKEPESEINQEFDFDPDPTSEEPFVEKEKISKAEETEFSGEEHKRVGCGKEPVSEIIPGFDFDPNPGFQESFFEWDVGAPLEVIYEEEEEEDLRQTIGRYPFLSLYYPASDSESSSGSEMDFPVSWNWVSPEKMGFGWEEEIKEGMIEIEIENEDLDFYVEEENLIEIDISQLED